MAVGGEISAEKKRIELERRVLEREGHVISYIDDAKHVDQVILSLYSLAVCLFPLNHDSISGGIDEKYRDELNAVEVSVEDERTEWWRVFYKGSGFRAFARVLLYDVASNWLACFPASARKHVYDAFFLDGYATCLQTSESGSYDSTAVSQMLKDYLCFACWRMIWYVRWLESLLVVVNLKMSTMSKSRRSFLLPHN